MEQNGGDAQTTRALLGVFAVRVDLILSMKVI
jgi:hypothetical protein